MIVEVYLPCYCAVISGFPCRAKRRCEGVTSDAVRFDDISGYAMP